MPLNNGIRGNSSRMTTMPITIPMTVLSKNFAIHIPAANSRDPSILMSIAVSVRQIQRAHSSIIYPMTMHTTPWMRIPHSGSRAMHIPSAKNTPPMIPSISTAESLFYSE